MTVPERVRLDARVRGRVQGVGFRYQVLTVAIDARLEGWVANEADGSVVCRVEGTRTALDAFLSKIATGPPGARVDGIDTRWGAASGDLGPFRIRSGSHRGD